MKYYPIKEIYVVLIKLGELISLNDWDDMDNYDGEFYEDFHTTTELLEDYDHTMSVSFAQAEYANDSAICEGDIDWPIEQKNIRYKISDFIVQKTRSGEIKRFESFKERSNERSF